MEFWLYFITLEKAINFKVRVGNSAIFTFTFPFK